MGGVWALGPRSTGVGTAALALTIALAALIGVAAAPALAQDDTARARQLFEEGVEFADQGQFQEAANRFRQVLQIRSAAAVQYNLALALVELGEYVEARDLLQQVERDSSARQPMRRDARRVRQRIEPKIAHLTIELTDDVEGVEVVVDGRPLSSMDLGVRMAVDPGRHTIGMRYNGRSVGTQPIDLVEGGERTLRLTPRGAPSAAQTAEAGMMDDEPPMADSSETEEDDGGGGSIFGKWWFWTGVAVVIAGGVAIGVAASSGGDEVQGNLNPGVLTVNP